MASESSDQEKTEDPTPQRREDFRKRGQVAQSKELASVLLLVVGFLVIWGLGRFFLEQIGEVFKMSLTQFFVDSARDGDWIPATKFAISKSFLMVAPLGGILWIISMMSSVMQVGFLVNEEALKFDIKKIDPFAGIKRLVSMRSFVEGLKAVFKLTSVGVIVYLVFRAEIDQLPALIHLSVAQVFVYLGSVTFKLVAGVGAFMFILAGADFLFQKWDLEKKMRMTKQEVKEEHKSREGDPLIKARIRRTQREMAQRRMMEDVPKADVIVTNPTHIAVAIKYDATMVAPTIVAKGAGAIAEKIKEVARLNDVPIMENKPLARTIYKTLKIGQTIPRELYTAVAEVLSYIFRLKKRRES